MKFFSNRMLSLRIFIIAVLVVAFVAMPLGFGGSAFAQSSGVSSSDLTGKLAGSSGSSSNLNSLGNLPQMGGGPTGGVASAKVIDPVYSFGSVYNNGLVRHTFKIRNVGTGMLIIGGVSTSCGCTAARPTKKHVLPGQTSEIAVTLDAQLEKGPVKKQITIFTNDPKHEQIALTLTGDIKPEIEATPDQISFGPVKRGTQETKQIVITDLLKDKNFKIEGVSNFNHHIKVAAGTSEPGKRKATVNVTLTSSMPVGPFTDTVKVKTSREPISVVVFGTVTGDLKLDPAQVSFGIVPHHQGAFRIVKLTNTGKRMVKILDVSTTSHNVIARVEPIKPGKEYKITLQLEPSAIDGTLRGELGIRTDDPEQATLNVPYYGIIGSFKG